MQYLSFCFLIWAIAWVMPDLNTSFWTLAAMLWTPFNLYLILRTAYGSGRVAAAGKALFIWSATIVTFCIFVTGLVLLVLSQM
jgi:hypothetical protein